MIKSLKLSRLRSIPALHVLLLYCFIGWLFQPAFVSLDNIQSMLFSSSIVAPAILGTTFLLVLGRFDLSIGAVSGLAGMVTAILSIKGAPILLAVTGGLAAGLIAGSISGLLVGYYQLDPLIVTLAMAGVCRSVALVLNEGRIVAGITQDFSWITDTRVFSIPLLVIVMVFTGILASILGHHVVLLRRLYAVGSNQGAARNSGIDVSKLILFGYALSGLAAATTGILQVSRTLSASPLTFESLPIQAIAACVIGGSSLGGGKGDPLLSMLGLIAVVAMDNLIVILGISVDWQQGANGILLLLVVIWPILSKRLRIFPQIVNREKK